MTKITIETQSYMKKLRRLVTQRRKVRVFVRMGIWENIISYYSSAFTINSTTTTSNCTFPYLLVTFKMQSYVELPETSEGLGFSILKRIDYESGP